MTNLTLSRWVPYQLSSFYFEIQDRYDQKVELKNTTLIPQLWVEFG
jgi:hypothetical protein